MRVSALFSFFTYVWFYDTITQQITLPGTKGRDTSQCRQQDDREKGRKSASSAKQIGQEVVTRGSKETGPILLFTSHNNNKPNQKIHRRSYSMTRLLLCVLVRCSMIANTNAIHRHEQRALFEVVFERVLEGVAPQRSCQFISTLLQSISSRQTLGGNYAGAAATPSATCTSSGLLDRAGRLSATT